jgi:phage tail-like protein
MRLSGVAEQGYTIVYGKSHIREEFIMKMYSKLSILLLVMVSVFLLGQSQPVRDFNVPVSKYKFHVEINSIDAGYFESVNGLRIEQDIIEYQDEDSPFILKRAGRFRYGDIILRKGYLIGTNLNDWIEASRTGNTQSDGGNVTIILIDTTPPWSRGVEIKRWNCYGCFPRSWKLSPLNNKSSNMVTEEMVIAIEWFEEVEPETYVPY